MNSNMIYSILVLKDLIYSQEENEKLRAEFERFKAEIKSEIAELRVRLFRNLLVRVGDIYLFISLQFPKLVLLYLTCDIRNIH